MLGKIVEVEVSPDLWSLYENMYKSRLLEEAIAQLWQTGKISGEMHLGTGEEGVIAGVVAHIHEGDALALDHRGTAALLMRGVDPVLILRELLGQPGGLCGGQGGHMHLYSKEHLAASVGIVGAGGPAAAGFALAAQVLHPGSVAVAFFGEGAMNQGMLMEALNLAAAWNLPAVFVCKDDNWSITAQSGQLTGGSLTERVRGLGVPCVEVDGREVSEVWEAAEWAVQKARAGQGPAFLLARCVHIEGHFLGFQLIRIARHPLGEGGKLAGPLARAFLQRKGARLGERIAGQRAIQATVQATRRDPRRDPANDPLLRARVKLQEEPARLQALENQIRAEIHQILAATLTRTEGWE